MAASRFEAGVVREISRAISHELSPASCGRLRTWLPEGRPNTFAYTNVFGWYLGDMRHYMSSAQVADYLGITRDVLHARIRAREFKAPDVIIGDRFQGWSPETVEKYRQEQGGDGYSCDTEGLIAVIREIRTIAERVRTFGQGLQSPVPDGFSWVVAENLHVIAARLESALRSWLVLEQVNVANLRRVDGLVGAAWRGDSAESEEAAEAVQMPIAVSISAVDSHFVVDVPEKRRAAELLIASNELSSVMTRLPKIFDNPVSRLSARAIAVEKSAVDNKLRDLSDPV